MPKITLGQRHKISKFCGWTNIHESPFTDRVIGRPSRAGCHESLPKYPNDLNACKEFEQVCQKKGLDGFYIQYLIKFRKLEAYYEDDVLDAAEAAAFATAEQRCQAVLKVIEGLEDENE